MEAQTLTQVIKMLENLDRWITKGVEHAAAKSFDPSVLLTARLAPDQYNFTRQVQAAADAAKFLGARLSGKDAPKHPDTETTADELHARIASVVAYLKGFKPEDFATADTRVVGLAWMPGKGLNGNDYLHELALPNFYFHVTTAYSILRHNGVTLGKADFIGSLNLRDM